uniref:serine O-acetyltransferase n=1 Tax=Wollemia nobilis TaxID=56998 RepID=A0A0C9RQZ2_9CONI
MDLSLPHSAAINSSYQRQYKRWSSRDALTVFCNVNKDIGRGKFYGFSESWRKILKVAAENCLWRSQMEGIDQNSRGARTLAYCNGNGRDEDKRNGHVYSNSSSDREKFSQEKWENMFPAYMQSKGEELEEEAVAVEAENGNGCQGLNRARAAAAAAAAASAKELQSRVKSSCASQVVPPSLSAPPWSTAKPPIEEGKHITELMSADPIWAAMRVEARLEAEKEPLLSSYLYASILAHSCFERALGFVLANRLQNPTLLATQLMDVFDEVFMNDANIQQSIRLDVQAVKDRDPSCRAYSWALLYLKGYHALQSYRVAHALWNRGQRVLALALQSCISEVFAVDIHPAARIGKGILLDHGTGVVIGETAVVGDRVSMLQGVTLGGTGKEVGDRHPKIGGGVLIGAGATILGNITVGKGAMVAAGSLVLKDIPPHSMAAGTPAKVIGFLDDQNPALTMKHDATKGFCQLVAEDSLHSGAGI